MLCYFCYQFLNRAIGNLILGLYRASLKLVTTVTSGNDSTTEGVRT